jgi:low affinity Fe/Cu permease
MRNTMTPVEASADKESIFNRIADYVSAAMGRPTNIMIWLVLVVGWTLLFAAHVVSANANFLPGWFTGTAFNFPLNLITTVAELFIGFLVAAAANRSERNLELTLAAIADQEKHIEDVEAALSAELASNTLLTQQVHDMAAEIHAVLAISKS